MSQYTLKLSDFLLNQLWAEGVRHLFGIPGDFVLNLFGAVESDGRFRLVTLSHEPAVGFAADGCARITNNLGVCLTTYGAGGLNMVNAVACAYAEQSPLVILSGGPGRNERRAGMLIHHEVKNFDSQLKIFQEVTDYAVVLDDPATAARHVRRALRVARGHARPVYLEVPRDMVSLHIDARTPEVADDLHTDEAAVCEAADEIMARLRSSKNPVLIVGVEVHRFHLLDQVVALAERLGIPVSSSFLGKAVFPESHPQYIGTYLGTVSPPAVRAVVENSDSLLLFGERISDTGLGISSHFIQPNNTMICASRSVFIRHHRYDDVPLASLLPHLLSRAERLTRPGAPALRGFSSSPEVREPFQADEPIRVKHVISLLNQFLAEHPDVPVVADTGDAMFAAVDLRARACLAPAYYATMGFAVPAAIGLQVGSGARPLVLVGDGAFQMTGQEISHCPKLGLNPVVVLFKNNRWQMVQVFMPEARFNDLVNWPYARLAQNWGGRGFTVQTPGELQQALKDAWAASEFSVIEVEIEADDLSPILRGFVEGFRARVRSAPG